MKKILLAATVAFASLAAQAAESPEYLRADFAKADAFPGGWTFSGVDAELLPDFKETWGDAGAYKLIEFPGKGTFACSTSNYADASVQANQWLVSPTIHVTDDKAILSFSAAATNLGNIGTYSNTFKVKVSLNGPEPEKFEAKSLGSYSLNGTVRDYVIILSGYKDKDINLAFVNESTNPGVLGFGNIYVGGYYVDFTNNTVPYITPATVSFKTSLRTPVSCAGFTAELVAGGKTVSTFSETTQLYGDVKTFDVTFPERLTVPDDADTYPYIIRITPDYKDATPFEVEASVSRSVNYTTKVVVEECTGTWCQFCPRGAVTLEYYSDKYPETFLGIAVHGDTADANDPMSFGSPSQYILPLGGDQGFPLGRINRDMDFKYNFGNSTTLPPYFDQVSVNEIKITSLDVDFDKKTVSVAYEARLGYDADKVDYRAIAVITEDGVKGTEKEWGQDNWYHGQEEMDYIEKYGMDWIPYWKKYLQGAAVIKAEDMVYNHVARNLYPNFRGSLIGSWWKRDEPNIGKLDFALPDNIQDYNNCTLNVMMAGPDGKLVSFDRKPLTKSAVGSVGADATGYTAAVEGSTLVLGAEAGAKAEVFTADGAKVAETQFAFSTTSLDASAFRGLTIVRITGAEGSRSFKFMF